MSVRASSYPTKVARLIAMATLLLTLWFAQTKFFSVRTGLFSLFYRELITVIQNHQPSREEIDDTLKESEKLASLLLYSDKDQHRRNFFESLTPLLLAIKQLQGGNIVSAVELLSDRSKSQPLLLKTLSLVGITSDILSTAKRTQIELINEKNAEVAAVINREQPATWQQQYILIKESLVSLLGIQNNDPKINSELKTGDFYKEGVLIYLPRITNIPENITSLDELLALLTKLGATPKAAEKKLPDEVNLLRAQAAPLHGKIKDHEERGAKTEEIERQFEEKITAQSRSLIELLSRALKRLIENHANILN